METIFYFKTVQTNAIRVLFESLKNILSDVSFRADKTGVKLTTVDGTQTAIINLFLDSSKFEEYYSDPEVNIGLNLLSVYKILKGIKNTDTISFTIYRKEENNLYITTEHTDKKATVSSRIKLLDMDEKIYSIPDIKFNSFITMPSSDFQGYIADLATISSEIYFKTNCQRFTLSSSGDFADQTIVINENSEITDVSDEQTGTFNIKYIQLFTKSTNLCGTVEIYLKTGYPLTILYNVANLGQIKYCLAPKV